jgi:hypothetical protein
MATKQVPDPVSQQFTLPVAAAGQLLAQLLFIVQVEGQVLPPPDPPEPDPPELEFPDEPL